ncbi:MAG: hypothetical protein ACI35P_16275 [Bacillus sp. (in: firmicutes)]
MQMLVDNNQTALAYVRVVVGKEGEVVHICPNTLYHPSLEEQAELQSILDSGCLKQLDSKYNDVQVLVLFRKLVQENGQATIQIDNTVLVQEGFKEFWRERITKKIEGGLVSLRDEVYINERIDHWEKCYGENFIPTRKVENF